MKSTYGDIPVDVPRDREATFEPQSIPKRTRDVSGIEDKVLSMYARGMSQRDIAQTIEDIYGFEISHETVSAITDRVIETAILGYDVNGVKDILGMWIGEAEGKHYWMQIFDEIKGRGVEDVWENFIHT